MKCEKCNGTGNEGFISILVCSDCGGTGVARPKPEKVVTVPDDVGTVTIRNVSDKPVKVEGRTGPASVGSGGEATIKSGNGGYGGGDISIKAGDGRPGGNFAYSQHQIQQQEIQIEPEKCLHPLAAGIRLPAGSYGEICISPTVTPYFEPKKIQMGAIDPICPGTNMRFTIGTACIGGAPQLPINKWNPNGGSDELLSDIFVDPVAVDWDVFSCLGLGRECRLHVWNPNGCEIQIFTTMWGNPMVNI